jgi:hypothetical protein
MTHVDTIQQQDCICGGKKQSAAATAGKIPDRWFRLALVGLEVHRQPAVGLQSSVVVWMTSGRPVVGCDSHPRIGGRFADVFPALGE